MSAILDKVRAFLATGETTAAVDAVNDGIDDALLTVYTDVDDMMQRAALDDVRAVLAGLVGMPIVLMLSGLTITLPWWALLSDERAALVKAVREADPERADELLRGLE